ncbi:sigma-70 family RNA polymerase sigma factor [Oceaniradius stylonematis]|uniref:Sigma-70 family RNA polymerase sigma factor n=2 Tax=Oceaniradius stylonematis TaxID=2184161 RepID=A0A3A8ADE4_9HYPH|nr:sigma-70 family RNA polymerase sigma factor [Oceaniradius stylonematis]RKF07368.1 sigma-70 family RNA polymerase sigma factor [Oceaniradius stylonematis]RNC96720.1 MAG: sigma-70 family RNA polymerase sigma factor [Oricola sp.]
MMSEQHKHFAALAARVASDRDKTAFAELFDFFAPRIKAYLRRLGLEDSAAEDIAQEVMIVLWHKANLFDPTKSSLSTWLFRVARNRRIDALRRDKSGLLDPDEPMLRPAESPLPDAMMDGEQRDARVRDALAGLPEEQVGLIRMAFFLGYSHSRIADETGLPLGTVKSRIRLAFGRLRRALEKDEQVDTDF